MMMSYNLDSFNQHRVGARMLNCQPQTCPKHVVCDRVHFCLDAVFNGVKFSLKPVLPDDGY